MGQTGEPAARRTAREQADRQTLPRPPGTVDRPAVRTFPVRADRAAQPALPGRADRAAPATPPGQADRRVGGMLRTPARGRTQPRRPVDRMQPLRRVDRTQARLRAERIRRWPRMNGLVDTADRPRWT